MDNEDDDYNDIHEEKEVEIEEGEAFDEELEGEGEGFGEGGEEEKSEWEMVDDALNGFFTHTASVFSVSLNQHQPSVALSGGEDDKAFLWDIKDGHVIYELTGHKESIVATGFNFDGTLAATGCMDGTVRIWEVKTGHLVCTCDGPAGSIEWLKWHPVGNIVLAGSEDSTLWMWFAVDPPRCMNVFAGHAGPVSSGAFTHSGKQIVSGSADGTVRVWSPKTAECLYQFTGDLFHQDTVNCLEISKDDTLVLTGSSDHTAKLSNITNGKIMCTFGGHADSVETVGFCNSHPLAATGSLDHKIKIWDLHTQSLRQTCSHKEGVTKLLWHPDKPIIYSVSLDKSLKVWDARTADCVREFLGHQDNILDLDVDKEGKLIVTSSDDNTCLVFSMDSPQ